jgi:hypothetical protein
MANARGGASSFTPSTVSSQSGVLMVGPNFKVRSIIPSMFANFKV